MATNPTAVGLNELVSDGEKLADGLHTNEVALGVQLNKEVVTRADLEALKTAEGVFTAAESHETEANALVQAADAEGSLFISQFVGWMSLIIGGSWSDAWLETGLPNNSLAVPTTRAKRFACLDKMSIYLTNHPQMEVNHPLVVITAAKAHTLHEALSDAEAVAAGKHNATKAAKIARDAAEKQFRKRYRNVIDELGQLMGPEDPRWYDFGLSRPADPETSEKPRNLTATAASGGLVIAKIGGARRAHSFNFYRQIIGVDAEPVKVANTSETELNIPGLPVGATVKITATGVNDAGEGPACDPVSVVVT